MHLPFWFNEQNVHVIQKQREVDNSKTTFLSCNNVVFLMMVAIENFMWYYQLPRVVRYTYNYHCAYNGYQ